MTVSLPQNDGSPVRSEQLEDARRVYGYTYNWPPDVAVAAAVPSSDTYSLHYIEKLVPLALKLFENTVMMKDLVSDPRKITTFIEEEVFSVARMSPAAVGHWFFDVHTRMAEHITEDDATTVESYGDLFAAIDPVPVWEDDKWMSDESFAWQRIAGVNPMVLERIDAMPDGIEIGQDEWARAIGTGALSDALAEGRLFACDYGLLDGVECGVTNGRQKYMFGPYAVFAAVDGKLRPVAIQMAQAAGSPVFAPDDGEDWSVAKLAVQVADASHHETIAHLGRTHMVMEACTLATHRQLATRHPLHVLLMPHCEFTLPINQSAASSLIAPNGTIDKAFAPTITNCAKLVRHGIDTWPLDAASPAANTAARGWDPAILPEAPYRDDGILVWDAVATFVGAYVRRYYHSDADVVADTELAAWVEELTVAGRLAGVPEVRTVQALAGLVTTFVFTGSAQHSAVNFPQFPYMGAIPNMAGALWKPWKEGVPMLDVLPPPNMAVLQFNTVYQLSGLRINWLGRYPEGTFTDPRVVAIVEQFQADLAAVEVIILDREETRWLPYPHLLPSTIPASIHI